MKLPIEVDNLIFKELEAEYQVNPAAVSKGLLHDDKGLKIYLGTYFPRSFVETYKIFEDLYSNNLLRDIFNKKKTITILDIGSGTGGAIIGLLWFIKENRFFDKGAVDILSIDKNEAALNYQKIIISRLFVNKEIPHNLICIQDQYLNTEDFEYKISKQIGSSDFDIILSSKFISELYFNSDREFYGMYNSACTSLEKYLKPDGLLILLDTTNPAIEKDPNSLIPKILCRSIRAYLKNKDSKLTCLLPLSCAFWANNCEDNDCFQQREYEINHSKRSRDYSRVVFRVLAHKDLVKQVLSYVNTNSKYMIAKSHICEQGDCKVDKSILCKDAFSLKDNMKC